MLNAEALAAALVLDVDVVVRADGPLLREAAAELGLGCSLRSTWGDAGAGFCYWFATELGRNRVGGADSSGTDRSLTRTGAGGADSSDGMVLPYKEGVGGSSPSAPTEKWLFSAAPSLSSSAPGCAWSRSARTSQPPSETCF